MYVVLQYRYDLVDMSSTFSHVIFVTKDVDLAEKYKEKHHDNYIGNDIWEEVHIKEVKEMK